MPDGTVETGAIEEQWLPYHDDGDEAGYLAYQYAWESPYRAGYDSDDDIYCSLRPCRPCVLIVGVCSIERVNSTTRKHYERIDQKENNDSAG